MGSMVNACVARSFWDSCFIFWSRIFWRCIINVPPHVIRLFLVVVARRAVIPHSQLTHLISVPGNGSSSAARVTSTGNQIIIWKISLRPPIDIDNGLVVTAVTRLLYVANSLRMHPILTLFIFPPVTAHPCNRLHTDPQQELPLPC
jgi:hypothetical protein